MSKIEQLQKAAKERAEKFRKDTINKIADAGVALTEKQIALLTKLRERAQ